MKKLKNKTISEVEDTVLQVMTNLLNKNEMTIDEYEKIKIKMKTHCKENNLYYDEEHSRIYKIEDNKSTIVRQ